MNKLLLVPLVFVVLVSGCSVPGLPGFGGGTTGQYANDIIIIKDQSVFPASVKANQDITLVTYIQNLGTRGSVKGVKVNLYDTCGVFSKIRIDRPSSCNKISDRGLETGQTGCDSLTVLPQEVKEIRWVLTPDQNNVKVPISSCKLKVSVDYPYSTSSQTELYFINNEEYQRQQEQNTLSSKSSSHTKSDGPVEAYVLPDNNVRQPIPVLDKNFVPVSLYVENVGSGFLSKPIKGGDLKILFDGQGIGTKAKNGDCSWTIANNDAKTGTEIFSSKELTLIGKKSPPSPCLIGMPSDVKTEKTTRLSVELSDYSYQFRKESSVSIEPVGYEKPAEPAK